MSALHVSALNRKSPIMAIVTYLIFLTTSSGLVQWLSHHPGLCPSCSCGSLGTSRLETVAAVPATVSTL